MSNFDPDSLFLTERKCRICGEVKDLMDGFYKTHKNSLESESTYSYECKDCTKNRVSKNKKIKYLNKKVSEIFDYPDW